MTIRQAALGLILTLSLLLPLIPSRAQDPTCTDPLTLTVGEQGQALGGAELYAAPTERFASDRLYPGTVFTVLAGPTCSEGVNWWQVAYEGSIGWIANYDLVPLPAGTDPTNATLTPTDGVAFNGVQFAYDTALWGARVQASLAPTQVWYALEDGTWVGMPESRRFTFIDRFPAATLLIYPVDNWHNDEAAGLALAVRLLIDKRAELDLNATTGDLPALPIRRAAQNIRAQRAYIEGAGVVGFRFVTRYTQSFAPFTGDDLSYTFQGYSADGRYYVAFSAPLNVPDLPSRLTIDLERELVEADDDGFAAYQAYLLEAETALNSMDLGLAGLDAMVQSLSISDPTAQPAFICAAPTQWQVGETITATADRSLVGNPGWDAVTGSLLAGQTALLQDGPACAMGEVWWLTADGWFYE